MTGRGVIVTGGLAALGLVVAYATWQREPERNVGDVVIVDTTKGDLASIQYEDDSNSIDIKQTSDSGESGVWLHVQEKPPKPPKPPEPSKDGGAPMVTAAPPPSPAPKPKPRRELRGDEPAEKMLAMFAPFRSPRAFGVLDAKKQKELGLQNPKKKLLITARGETREFAIGQPVETSGESYLRDVKDGRIYLMPRQLLSDLQGAAFRLVDRKMHTFKIADVSRIVVGAAGKTRAFTVKNGKDAAGYQLVPAGGDKPEEMARNWHDKVWRLYPMELLGKGEVPAPGQPKVSTRVEYFDGSKSVGFLEIAKLEVPPGTPPAPGPHGTVEPQSGIETYGRTEHTAGWVRLRNDPSTFSDADKIAAGS